MFRCCQVQDFAVEMLVVLAALHKVVKGFAAVEDETRCGSCCLMLSNVMGQHCC